MGRQRAVRFEVDGNGCHVCVSHRPGSWGYPAARARGKAVGLHRLVFEREVRPLKPGEVVRHRCDNRRCINPAHLIAGTHADNVADRVRRGRSATGERNGRAKLTADVVRRIRADRAKKAAAWAAELKVSERAVRSARDGKTWRYV